MNPITIDYEVVLANYAKYPNIGRVMNETWPIGERKKDPKRTHPLIELLWAAGDIQQRKLEFNKLRAGRFHSRPGEGYLEGTLRRVVIPLPYRAIFTLEYLDSSLGRLKDYPRFLLFRKELQNYDQFWDAYSEIECATLASKMYPIELKPRIGDLKVIAKDTAMLIEVRALRPPLSSSRPGFGAFRGVKIPQILKEKSKQIGRLPRGDTTPCLVIIDASGSILQPDFEVPDGDSIPKPISAVLIYKMDFGWDGKPHLTSREFVENHSPKNPLGAMAESVCNLFSATN